MGTPAETSGRESAGTSTLDLALRVLEHLSLQSQPISLAQIALAMQASKPTVYRHLVTLVRHGFVRQEPETSRYEAGIKLLVLGESVRARFDVVTAAREDMTALRDATEHAVTICRVIDGELVVLDLIQGRTIIEFGTRPGTRLALHASAHGKVWLAFGPPVLMERTLTQPMRAWTVSTITDADRLRATVAEVRERGWATAPDEVIVGVNTLAAPIFDHRNTIIGSVAIVGATQFIPPVPPPGLIDKLLVAARRISHGLGWRSPT